MLFQGSEARIPVPLPPSNFDGRKKERCEWFCSFSWKIIWTRWSGKERPSSQYQCEDLIRVAYVYRLLSPDSQRLSKREDFAVWSFPPLDRRNFRWLSRAYHSDAYKKPYIPPQNSCNEFDSMQRLRVAILFEFRQMIPSWYAQTSREEACQSLQVRWNNHIA